MHSSLWLTALLVVPLVGSLLAALVRNKEGRSYAVAVATASVEMALALIVSVLYNGHIAGSQTFDFASRHVLAAPCWWG